VASIREHLDFILEVQKDSPAKIIGALAMIRSGL
jgi:hypothetical protein